MFSVMLFAQDDLGARVDLFRIDEIDVEGLNKV
jgi:hypothetical protein